MSRNATSGKVSVVSTKLGLEKKEEGEVEGEKKRGGPAAAILGITSGLVAAFAFGLIGRKTYVVKERDTLSKVSAKGLKLCFHF